MPGREVMAVGSDDVERRYRDLVEQLPMPLTVHRGGTMVYVNSSLVSLIGVDDVRKLIGRELFDFVEPIGPDPRGDRLRGLYDGAQSSVRLRVRTVDGRTFDVESTGIPIVFDGEPAVVSVFQDVTARVRAEAALRSSEARYRSLVQRGSDLTAVIDRDARFTYVSPSAKQLFGVEAADLVGQRALDYVHPDDLVLAEDRVAQFFDDTEGPHELLPLRIRAGDGSWRHIELLVESMLDEPSVAGVVISVRDVTDRAEMEHALRASEARFRALVRHATDVIVVLDRSASFTYLSPAVVPMLGMSPAEVLGRHLSEVVHPDDYGILRQRIDGDLAEESDRTPVVCRFAHRDGSYRWVEVIATRHYEDPAVDGIVLNARDITGRVEAEAAMRVSEVRHRALIEHISDIVVVTDAEGLVLYASPALERVLGWPAEESVGRSLFSVMHPRDRVIARGWIATGLDSGIRLYGPHRYRFQRSDGAWRHLEVMANFRLDDPAVGGVVFTARDITEQVDAEEGLRHSALHDPLTGLPNRTLLTDRLRSALAGVERNGGTVALLVVDLDRFKEVNDSFGHEAGDAVLVELAARMRAVLRDVDTVGRLGGDEFAVVLPSAGSEEAAFDTARRLQACLAAPVTHDGVDLVIGASIGMALGPVHGDEVSVLLRGADAAMFRAKHHRLGIAVSQGRDEGSD